MIPQLVTFSRGLLEIGCVDNGAIGEAKAITARFPAANKAAGMTRQKAVRNHQITVNENDDIAMGVIDAAIPPLSRAAMGLLNQPHMRETLRRPTQPIRGPIGGSVIHHHHLITINLGRHLLTLKCQQTLLKDRPAVVGRDDDADEHRGNRKGGMAQPKSNKKGDLEVPR